MSEFVFSSSVDPFFTMAPKAHKKEWSKSKLSAKCTITNKSKYGAAYNQPTSTSPI